MFGEAVLQPVRVDVLAARDDHVVLAADDVQPAGVVEVAHVAGAGEPVDYSLCFPGGVTRAQVAADEEASGPPRPDGPAASAVDAHRASRDRSAHGFRSIPQLEW